MQRLRAVVGPDGRLAQADAGNVAWWSATKPMIAACALVLVQQGVFALDAPLRPWPFSLRLLLQHRAGVPDYGGLPEYRAAVARGDAAWTADEFLSRCPPDQLVFPPGEGWAYSNIGFLLVRQAIEHATGDSLGAALRRLVLGPLGLKHSFLAVLPEDMGITAFPGGHGYDPGWVSHGTLIGPIGEVALGLHRLLQGTLLDPMLLRMMLAPHPVGGAVPGRPWPKPGYGLGLMVGPMAGGTARRSRSRGIRPEAPAVPAPSTSTWRPTARTPSRSMAMSRARPPRNGRSCAC